MNKKFNAFTLVELIVVITILAILGTIGFISLQGYSVNARDSVRISDTKTFLKALNIYQTKNGEVPLPDDMTTITGSGVVFSYQGTLSGSVITQLGQGQVPLDPLLETPYLYATNEGRTKVQLLSYHEKNTSSLELQNALTHAETTYSDMFPKVIGAEIGILVNEDNSPVGTGTLYLPSLNVVQKYIISSDEMVLGTGSTLVGRNPISSCKRILSSGGSYGNDEYVISPTGLLNINVYCDMEIDGGGWVLVARSGENKSPTGNFGWLYSRGSVTDYWEPYSLGAEVKLIDFNEILYGAFSGKSEIDTAIKISADDDVVKNELDSYSRGGICQDIFNNSEVPFNVYGTCPFSYWGFIPKSGAYHTEDPTWNGYGLNMVSFNHPHSFGHLNGRRGMLMVR